MRSMRSQSQNRRISLEQLEDGPLGCLLVVVLAGLLTGLALYIATLP
jgi:hypothetical protein